MKIIDTLICSDLHLGTKTSRADLLLKELKQYQFNRLILNGDIFEDLNFTRFNSEQWELLSYFRKLSNPKYNTSVIWVLGNHDYKTLTTASHFLGLDVYEEYAWTFNNKKFLAIHGDQFDRFLINNATISKIALSLFINFQRFPSVSRYIDRLSTKWLRLQDKVKNGALEYAHKKKVDFVFCGHNHVPEMFDSSFNNQTKHITYINTGSWIQNECSYATVGGDGVKLHHIK